VRTGRLVAAWFLVSLGLGAAGCAPEPTMEGAARDFNADTTRPAAPDRSTLEPGALATVTAEPAYLPPLTDERPFEVAIRTREQIGGHSRRFGTITLQVSLRSRAPNLSQYPCTSCHLGITVAMKDDRIKDAHQNIRPVHPKATGAVCSTCHAPDDVEKLAVKSGERPTLDHSYRLCGQCHFSQVTSWANGAHGKRLDGWQGRRIVMNCTDCHDPHSPAVEPRIPFRAPRLPRGDAH